MSELQIMTTREALISQNEALQLLPDNEALLTTVTSSLIVYIVGQ